MHKCTMLVLSAQGWSHHWEHCGSYNMHTNTQNKNVPIWGMSEVDGTTDNRFVYSPHFSTRLKKCKMVSVFTSGYVNTETILHFFYKITNERGMKTVFTYTHVKWFYGQSERTYYFELFHKTYWKYEKLHLNHFWKCWNWFNIRTRLWKRKN